MRNDLNANKFTFSKQFCSKELLKITAGIIESYNDITAKAVKLENDENIITSFIAINYLKNESFKRKSLTLSNYHFDYEIIENSGRSDIRVLPINPYVEDKAYYIFECKRLNSQNLSGTTGLNAEYIKNGMCRFITEYYSSYYTENGMIGYVVEKLNIIHNIKELNKLLDNDFVNDRKNIVNARVVEKIKQIDELNGHNHIYNSKHKTDSGKEIILLHLMLDFSKNIS